MGAPVESAMPRATILIAILAALVCGRPVASLTMPQIPTFRVDPAWPKPLPKHWIVGAVVGVAVDRRDHV